MFQLFVAKTDEAFQRNLISQPVVAADFKDFCIDEAFDQTEDVCIRAALDLTQESLFRGRQEIDLVDVGQTVGEEFVGSVKRASPDNIVFYVPTHPF